MYVGDFIDKFFAALGWDIKHNIQKNPYEQGVRVERLVQVAKAQKRADYFFFVSQNFRDVKFFVEAKKPSRNLEMLMIFFKPYVTAGMHQHLLQSLQTLKNL